MLGISGLASHKAFGSLSLLLGEGVFFHFPFASNAFTLKHNLLLWLQRVLGAHSRAVGHVGFTPSRVPKS